MCCAALPPPPPLILFSPFPTPPFSAALLALGVQVLAAPAEGTPETPAGVWEARRGPARGLGADADGLGAPEGAGGQDLV